ncbi:hypothetical protein ACFQRB_15930 [Halobaculum litoreum]|uniref:Uncharacterized protein n=1 Tax=Halobaculum litoreum TaxID=3031998 RepID=A0ABD5XWQ3_9EURY
MMPGSVNQAGGGAATDDDEESTGPTADGGRDLRERRRGRRDWDDDAGVAIGVADEREE